MRPQIAAMMPAPVAVATVPIVAAGVARPPVMPAAPLVIAMAITSWRAARSAEAASLSGSSRVSASARWHMVATLTAVTGPSGQGEFSR